MKRASLLPAALLVLAVVPAGSSAAGSTAADAAAAGAASGAPGKATLTQCVTAAQQSERSATFAGEMSSIAGSARMQIRIDLLERTPGQANYHLVVAPGLGAWRSSAPGVKVFKYIKQVTNLGAPAFYRGSLRFRWLSSRGRTIASAQLRTRRCEQPLLAPEEAAPGSVAVG